MSAVFRIELIDRYWLSNDAPHDPCVHGHLRVWIDDFVASDGGEDLGVSQSALALSRTLLQNHSDTQRVAPRLLHHGCGESATSLGIGCPIGADWLVTHAGETVELDRFARWDTTSEAPVVALGGTPSRVPFDDYRREIVELSKAVLAFASIDKEIHDDWSRAGLIGWQVELRRTLAEVADLTNSNRSKILGMPSADVPAAYRLATPVGSNAADRAELDRFVELLVTRAAEGGIELRTRDFDAVPGWISFRLRAWDGSSKDDVLAALSAVLEHEAPDGASIGVDYPWNTARRRRGLRFRSLLSRWPDRLP